jgi:hypothetical protein
MEQVGRGRRKIGRLGDQRRQHERSDRDDCGDEQQVERQDRRPSRQPKANGDTVAFDRLDER